MLRPYDNQIRKSKAHQKYMSEHKKKLEIYILNFTQHKNMDTWQYYETLTIELENYMFATSETVLKAQRQQMELLAAMTAPHTSTLCIQTNFPNSIAGLHLPLYLVQNNPKQLQF